MSDIGAYYNIIVFSLSAGYVLISGLGCVCYFEMRALEDRVGELRDGEWKLHARLRDYRESIKHDEERLQELEEQVEELKQRLAEMKATQYPIRVAETDEELLLDISAEMEERAAIEN
ncbi:uncharacterized protein BO66DRAFT_440061 [Aspergillus aculeatinus CBS 121060]|uniref:Uncharacterized protein n=1 Tax=Aspergillus aculeatinus CBS 121060 TaxID=1448322 RepID=A0ACD1H3Z4_9EURO|nr:hypothetical protein BO66DRAFT_440061 [Aspergillus aculeatinus CBS 121060]RAH68446.1 hypothetical protein BO66DRAFT_440061 [Aspergillus aculeatinus CBS 121060]